MAITSVSKLNPNLPQWKNEVEPALSAESLGRVNTGINLNAATLNTTIDNVINLQDQLNTLTLNNIKNNPSKPVVIDGTSLNGSESLDEDFYYLTSRY